MTLATGGKLRRVLQEPEEVSEVSLRGLPGGRDGPQTCPHRRAEKSEVTY